jgi:N4-gp56 family major capsid protein
MAGLSWGTSSDGGYLYADELSEYLREQVRPTAKFRALCDAKDFTDKGLHRGQQFNWNVFSPVVTNGTTLTEGTSIPVTKFTITQGTGTVNEYGNSVPFTSKLDLLSKQSCQAAIRQVLSRDCAETLDRDAHAQFTLTPLRVVPASGTDTSSLSLTTNGTATLTNNVALGKNHIRSLVDTMKGRNIPPYVGDDYAGIAIPSTWRQVRNDLESVFQYTESGYSKVIKGEIGRYEGMRFCEQTNILAGRSNNGTAWTSGKSDWAYFFGEDTVAEAFVVPPEIRGKVPGDYGRDLGMAWYALEGFALVHSSVVNARIIKWDSAA